MQPLKPTELLARYAKGHLTASELHYQLIQSAAYVRPAETARLLPSDNLRAIRAEADSPPESLEGCPRAYYQGSWIGPYDLKAEELDNRRLWFDGVWLWHRYFKDNESRE
jgi:hypothetical protein